MTDTREWNNWIIGVLLTLTLTASGWAWTKQTQSADDVRKDFDAFQLMIQQEQSRQNERIAVLEAQWQLTMQKLERMEEKIDQILSRAPPTAIQAPSTAYREACGLRLPVECPSPVRPSAVPLYIRPSREFLPTAECCRRLD